MGTLCTLSRHFQRDTFFSANFSMSFKFSIFGCLSKKCLQSFVRLLNLCNDPGLIFRTGQTHCAQNYLWFHFCVVFVLLQTIDNYEICCFRCCFMSFVQHWHFMLLLVVLLLQLTANIILNIRFHSSALNVYIVFPFRHRI